MSPELIEIDGAQGEGGGQVLRTSIALSMVTGKTVRLFDIRARRRKPGLQRQHLTAVRAAAEICHAQLDGARLGSMTLTFTPGTVRPGNYRFDVGTAGSATLVLQTVLPGLLLAEGPSRLDLRGGTHNPGAPPFDFLAKTFLPQIRRMGPTVSATLHRHGFYPAGGGAIEVSVSPAPHLAGFELLERGALARRQARAIVAGGLPDSIARRELRVLSEGLGLHGDEMTLDTTVGSAGPGNVVMLELEYEGVTEVITGFGQRGVPAERVAGEVVERARRYRAVDAPVGECLADQLLIPLALAGAGAFRTLLPSLHTRTNLEVIRQVLGVRLTCKDEGNSVWRIEGAGRVES